MIPMRIVMDSDRRPEHTTSSTCTRMNWQVRTLRGHRNGQTLDVTPTAKLASQVTLTTHPDLIASTFSQPTFRSWSEPTTVTVVSYTFRSRYRETKCWRSNWSSVYCSSRTFAVRCIRPPPPRVTQRTEVCTTRTSAPRPDIRSETVRSRPPSAPDTRGWWRPGRSRALRRRWSPAGIPESGASHPDLPPQPPTTTPEYPRWTSSSTRLRHIRENSTWLLLSTSGSARPRSAAVKRGLSD